MNDRRGSEALPPADELERRIDAALRRQFEPPATLDSLAERALARRSGLRRRGLRRLGPVLLVGAAAAALLAAWLAPWSQAPERSKPTRVERIARVSSSLEPRVRACQPVGPLESSARPPEQVRSPDLTRLYSAMDACQRSAASFPCPENDGIAESLQATYGQEIELRPDALGFLQGPFASADWPTATILTGTAGDHTSVLVAERDSTLDCCVCVDLPEESGLKMFTWQVGNVVLTEITPLEEPQLLAFFE